MNEKWFIGIDISKEKVDIACVDIENNVVFQNVISNNDSKLKSFFVKVFQKLKLNPFEVLICCEQTGIYNRPLERVCVDLSLALWVETAIKIKRAASNLRGKSDKMDALRIAEYGKRYVDKKSLYKETDIETKKLQTLLNARETIIGEISRMKQQLNESKRFDVTKHKLLKSCFDNPIKALTKQLAQIEKEINLLVEQSQEMKENSKLLSSIPGIGRQNALQFIVYTNNFKLFSSPKHLACYAGVAPFPNESGTIIKKHRVSHLANKKLKSLLHMAAMSCIRAKGEIKEYYIRKVKEGKNKMLVLNNIRNKLIQRMFAVINRKTEYVQNYLDISTCKLP